MATSQLLCVRCNHSEDFHNWQTGPCSVKGITPPAGHPHATACDCYGFVSPFDSEYLASVAYHEQTGLSHETAVTLAKAEYRQPLEVPDFRKERNAELLRNALRIADHHRKHCDGIDCNISLNSLYALIEQAGIEVTVEERARFI